MMPAIASRPRRQVGQLGLQLARVHVESSPIPNYQAQPSDVGTLARNRPPQPTPISRKASP